MVKVKNTTKSATTIGVAGAVSAYGAGFLQAHYGVPLEVGAPVVGFLLAWLGRWAAKLDPAT